MKPLLPTLKERQRYIVYETISAHPLDADISEALLHRLAELLGVFGMADAGILSIAYDNKQQAGILRCDHKQVPRVKAGLLMITHLGHQQVIIKVRGISGTLKASKRFLPITTTKETTKGLRKKQNSQQENH